ncbi:MAG TPA: C13 family peptidase [Allosphingosinicella sp.]|uniref:C13 family peptidase n=1 Tax=Allosphingosinicella sp. TaxID=2823234 RepID=UPI002EDB185B
MAAFFCLLGGSVTSQVIAPVGPGPNVNRNTAWVAFNRSPQQLLTDHRRLDAALDALKPQRPGTVDAYVVVAGLNSDPVFGREAREAGRVLSRRFDAAGRTLVLAMGGEEPAGSPHSLSLALARVAELADRNEDVLVLYTTSHGAPGTGLEYLDAQRGMGNIPPLRLRGMVEGMPNRLVIISACYSGIFVPVLASDSSVIVTAAAADRASFGCDPGNDWTYFGDALINRALRKPQPLAEAFEEAHALVTGWEGAGILGGNSNPQLSVGANAARWLAPLEARMPKTATAPVGRSPAAGATRR